MTLVQLGEQVAMQLAGFAEAARQREMEPVSCIVGRRQFNALVAWVKATGGFEVIQAMQIDGLPVWRDDRDYHLEIECIRGRETDQLEARLQA
jgi:hypothetical protein